ncbi:tail protein [Ruegeria phage vB_RpoP-V13]|uniref:Tail protein n=1 Tax=Ruegeria phage vB_RpoP-V13 TaxID=2218612 RepID=A0A2Z4QGN6_9CAUD|nr:virion structural protein [Ruegeria phage vB_RpoP-V13]AWY09415.1 tail protein [Ruegeria phage vB_RpoP-V13]
MAQSVTNTDNSSALANSLFTTLTSGISVPADPDFSADRYNFDPATDATAGLYDDIVGATLAEVTAGSGTIDGTGAFDVFMQALDKHLEREFKNNRITGSQYAEVYTAVANQAMGQAVGFVLQKDQARWNAVTAQMQARVAEIEAVVALVNLERAKIEAAESNFKLNLTAAQYGLTKMQIATEEATHDGVTTDNAIKEYNLNYLQPAELAIKQYERMQVMPSTVAMNNVQVDRILPAQAAIAEFQNRVLQPLEQDIQELQRDRIIPVQADMEEFKRDYIQPVELAQQQHILNQRMPQETALIKEQVETQRANTLDTRVDGLTPISGVVGLQKRNLTSDADIKDYNLANTLPTQVTLLGKQIIMTTEQGEAERAKTLNTRSDGATVVGSVGKQKDLYTQQIDSFIKDAQHKAAKLYLDSWVTRKTLDDAVQPPSEMSTDEVGDVIHAVRTNNSL